MCVEEFLGPEFQGDGVRACFHPLPKDDLKRRCPDTSKMEKLLGWKPKVKFEEGLKRTITWFSSKG